jgi:hypothetical protein
MSRRCAPILISLVNCELEITSRVCFSLKTTRSRQLQEEWKSVPRNLVLHWIMSKKGSKKKGHKLKSEETELTFRLMRTKKLQCRMLCRSESHCGTILPVGRKGRRKLFIRMNWFYFHSIKDIEVCVKIQILLHRAEAIEHGMKESTTLFEVIILWYVRRSEELLLFIPGKGKRFFC